MRSAFALALLVLSLGLVAAGCGGDDEPTSGEASASEWAEDFCTVVNEWTDELERVGDELGDVTSLSADSIEAAADDVNAATDQFVEDVRGLGSPDTVSGQEIEDSLQELADTVEAEKDEVEEAVGDASGLTEVAGAVAAIGTSLTAMATSFQTTLQAFEDADVDGELETALEESDACDELVS